MLAVFVHLKLRNHFELLLIYFVVLQSAYESG
jgi:hypothetical protein